MAIAVGLATGAICVAVGVAARRQTRRGVHRAGHRAARADAAGQLAVRLLRLGPGRQGVRQRHHLGASPWCRCCTWPRSDASVTMFVLAWGGAGSVRRAGERLQAGILPRLLRARHVVPRASRPRPALPGREPDDQRRVPVADVRPGRLRRASPRSAPSAAPRCCSGPFFIVLSGVGLVAVPEAARVLRRSPSRCRSSACCSAARRPPRHWPGAWRCCSCCRTQWGHELLGEVWLHRLRPCCCRQLCR